MNQLHRFNYIIIVKMPHKIVISVSPRLSVRAEYDRESATWSWRCIHSVGL